MENTTKTKNNWIEILRLLFTASIAMYHGAGYAGIKTEWFPYGYEAVIFFFILTGFLMGKSLGRDSKKWGGRYRNGLRTFIFTSLLAFIRILLPAGFGAFQYFTYARKRILYR